jgi:hypothetical protein
VCPSGALTSNLVNFVDSAIASHIPKLTEKHNITTFHMVKANRDYIKTYSNGSNKRSSSGSMKLPPNGKALGMFCVVMKPMLVTHLKSNLAPQVGQPH